MRPLVALLFVCLLGVPAGATRRTKDSRARKSPPAVTNQSASHVLHVPTGARRTLRLVPRKNATPSETSGQKSGDRRTHVDSSPAAPVGRGEGARVVRRLAFGAVLAGGGAFLADAVGFFKRTVGTSLFEHQGAAPVLLGTVAVGLMVYGILSDSSDGPLLPTHHVARNGD